MQTNATATILVGIAAWTVALIVLLIVPPGAEHRWWLWTCVAGIALGGVGLLYVRRMTRRERAQDRTAPAASEAERSGAQDSAPRGRTR